MPASNFQDYVTDCVYDCFKRSVPESRLYTMGSRLMKFETEYSNTKIPRNQVRGHGGRRRVDVYAEIMGYDGIYLSYCFEIKSSRQDLRSGYGLNFFAELNFIIVPIKSYGWRDPIGDAIDDVANNVGIITIDCENGLLHTVRPSWIMPTYPYIITDVFGG